MNESIDTTTIIEDLFDQMLIYVREADLLCVLSDHFITASKPVFLRHNCYFPHQFLGEKAFKF